MDAFGKKEASLLISTEPPVVRPSDRQTRELTTEKPERSPPTQNSFERSSVCKNVGRVINKNDLMVLNCFDNDFNNAIYIYNTHNNLKHVSIEFTIIIRKPKVRL